MLILVKETISGVFGTRYKNVRMSAHGWRKLLMPGNAKEKHADRLPACGGQARFGYPQRLVGFVSIVVSTEPQHLCCYAAFAECERSNVERVQVARTDIEESGTRTLMGDFINGACLVQAR